MRESTEVHEHDVRLNLAFLLNKERNIKTLSPPIAFRWNKNLHSPIKNSILSMDSES
jgi:hypothetical protein